MEERGTAGGMGRWQRLFARSAMRGLWCPLHAGRCMLGDARCMLHAAWCMVHAAWCMVHAACSMVQGVRCKV